MILKKVFWNQNQKKYVGETRKYWIWDHTVFKVGFGLVTSSELRQARAMCDQGDLGNIRVIQVEYAQDWLTEDLENKHDSGGNKQASWRTDPNQSGAGGCIGDIGTHAYNLIRFITDLNTEEISAVGRN